MITKSLNMMVKNRITKDVKLVKTDISVRHSINHLMSNISLYLQNLDVMDKYLVKKHVAMTTIYATNNVFPQRCIGSNLAK